MNYINRKAKLFFYSFLIVFWVRICSRVNVFYLLDYCLREKEEAYWKKLMGESASFFMRDRIIDEAREGCLSPSSTSTMLSFC